MCYFVLYSSLWIVMVTFYCRFLRKTISRGKSCLILWWNNQAVSQQKIPLYVKDDRFLLITFGIRLENVINRCMRSEMRLKIRSFVFPSQCHFDSCAKTCNSMKKEIWFRFIAQTMGSHYIPISIKVRFTSDNLFLEDEKMIFRSEKSFSNFSCMFLNPNIFFQFEF